VWQPLIDDADPGFASRWLWFFAFFSTAVFIALDAWTMFETGQPRALAELGLGRIVQGAREWPVISPAVAAMIGVEHLLAAGFLLWLSIVVVRRVPVPRPSPNELLVCATRQRRHLRIDWALGGLICLGIGALLAAHASEWIALVSRHVPGLRATPPGALIVLAGLVEFYGLQKLLRAAVVYGVPAARSFLVVIADPHHHGINNRLWLGDGQFSGARQVCLYHEQVVAVRPNVSWVRGRILGLSEIILTVQVAPNAAPRTVIVQAPASIEKTQQIADLLAGIWRAALRRDQYVVYGRSS
jgi:hypothetical protein